MLAGCSWAACSLGMTILNKLVVSKTRAPIVAVIVQMLATALTACASRKLHFGAGWVTWALAVPPLFFLMMVTSMIALKYVTVGTFTVVRNLGPIVTLLMETTFHAPENLQCDLRTAACVGMIAVGVLLYEMREVHFSAIGLCFLFANLFLACAERMAQRHLLAVQTVDVSKPALMVLNNGIGAIFGLAAVALFSPDEWRHMTFALRHKEGSSLALAASCVLGCAISYCGLWLQGLVTATSFMVLGSGVKLIVIAWGILVFADAAGPLSVLGATLAILGGYAYARGSK